ncbi:MAG: hypothetical protein Q8N60_04360 [Candidatus Diapherotrites archaeon]|nr:hypothetical protein [Candidatus Diapherotrites archaeon]
MKPVVYWRSALGLFWAFTFFILLSLVIGLTFLEKLVFYPYAIFLSAILVAFLVGFALFKKRSKSGLYLCLILSALFALNQIATLFILLIQPSEILPTEVFSAIANLQSTPFPLIVSALLLIWALLLCIVTWKSRPLFGADAKKESLAWFEQVQKTEAYSFK